MNRKDFDLLARAVKYLPLHCVLDGQLHHYRGSVAATLAAAIEEADGCAGFNRDLFLQRCGVK